MSRSLSLVAVMMLGVLALGYTTQAGSDDQWIDADWPGMFSDSGAGKQMLVRSIDLNLSQVPTRTAPAPGRKYDGFLVGPHFNIGDAPLSQILVLNQAAKDPDGSLAQDLVGYLRGSGSNALRLYDGYWWDPLGAATTIPILAHFGHIAASRVQQSIEDWPYVDARAMFDYLSGNGFDVAMVVSTIYYDPDTHQVYSTQQVADDVDGVLAKAAERNADTLAQWWKEHGHGRRLVLEIGNEGIGYSKDSKPTVEQYSRLVVSFARAIKQANPDVEVAVVVTHGFRGVIELCQEVAPLIDHVITHLYDQHRRDWGLTYPRDVTDYLGKLSAEIDTHGYEHAKILITEYNFDVWSRQRDTVGHAVANTARQIAIASHPRVSGMFIHNTPGTSLFSYSDGANWSLVAPGLVTYLGEYEGHLPDTRGKELGPRFRMLPTGYCQALLSDACRGELVDAYAMGDFGQIAFLMTREGDYVRILLSNLQPASLQARTPDLRDARVAVFSGESWNAKPCDELEQLYETNRRFVPVVESVVAPPFSVLLVEGLRVGQ
ncbi:MAG: hypothetical protein KAW89_04640 [Armatimonadetes bacterium]|nr:hypothetical protein [Armatimonadota bacterium]